jgi:UDPglucose 6-dehydrogenase
MFKKKLFINQIEIKMKIAVIGSGYVGLVTGTCLAETGNHITCVDIDQEKVEKLRSGEITIYEPGLETIFKRNIASKNLHFTTNLEAAVTQAEIIFLALPTPPQEDGSADLSYVLGISQRLARLIKKYTIIITKSTVPVGTGDKIEAILSKHLDKSMYDVVSNPEFLREGAAVADFMKPDRIVIGTSSEYAKATLKKLYKPYVRQNNPILFMDRASAEMTKYAANAYLATRISFMNEMANLCEKIGANVDNVRQGMGTDSRIGKRFLFPGIGFGGSCFPKDVRALMEIAHSQNSRLNILQAVKQVNHSQKGRLVTKLDNYFDNQLSGKTIAIWGLAFKPNTDDIREAPALTIIDALLDKGARVQVFDPEAMANVFEIYGNKIQFCNSQYEALKGADALVIATEWNVFRTPNYEKIRDLMQSPVVFDGRNVFDLEDLKGEGIQYFSIGRPDKDLEAAAALRSEMKIAS